MRYMVARARLVLDGMAALLGLGFVTVADAPRRLREERGQTMGEYAVVLAVITVGVVAVMTALSGGISGALNKVAGLLPK